MYTHTHIHKHIHTMEYYSAIKRNGISPFVATWMDSEGIMLSEISQSKTNIVYYHLHMESKMYNKLVNIIEKQAHRYRG